MSTEIPTRATLEELSLVEGKAELICGRIVSLMPTGSYPGRVAGKIYRLLDDHAEATGDGVAYPDGVGFAVPELTSGRESFCPDASYVAGARPDESMRFVAGPPTLAVEVRSEGDYGPAAETELAAKRADYFEAGTLVVWDVDPRRREIRSYHASEPDRFETFREGARAHAEAAVPGWSADVERVFR